MTNNDVAAASSSSAKNQNKPALEIKDKLRVLCLHGYRQNGDALRNKLGSFRKYVSKYVDFVFVTAPHLAAPLDPITEVVPEQCSWWANKDDGTFKGTNKGGPAFGFQESLKFVEEIWKTQGPFQGLLGFSQGACFAGLICGLSKKKLTSIKPEFAIFASGFLSGSLVHKSAYEETITMPTLHIYGTGDAIIPHEMSRELAVHFKNVEILEHGGGHYFPASSQHKQTYVNFFQDRLQEFLENLELQNSSNAAFIDAQAEDCSSADNEDDASV